MTDRSEIGGTPEGAEARDEDLLGPELRALLASLPSGIAPERDLMGDIAARAWGQPDTPRDVGGVRYREDAVRPIRRVGAWTGAGRWWLAAAAVALVAASSALTVLVMRATDRGDMPVVGAPPAGEASLDATFADLAVGEELRRVAAEYEAAVADLRAVLERNREVLTPGTMEIVEENLAVLDGALRETAAALRAAPGDAGLRETMMAAYERKLDFLRQAVALTAES